MWASTSVKATVNSTVMEILDYLFVLQYVKCLIINTRKREEKKRDGKRRKESQLLRHEELTSSLVPQPASPCTDNSIMCHRIKLCGRCSDWSKQFCSVLASKEFHALQVFTEESSSYSYFMYYLQKKKTSQCKSEFWLLCTLRCHSPVTGKHAASC